MDTRNFISFLCIIFLSVLSGFGMGGLDHHQKQRTNSHLYDFKPEKLFVFGDSYVDTGNIWESIVVPYGITFPGLPNGRFSDGRVSTDFLAKLMGIKSPLPYELRNIGGKKYLKHGMNFAYGGTGVFDTLSSKSNMTVQIDSFQRLLQEGVFAAADLNYSVALVSVAGNDYSNYLAKNGSLPEFPAFIRQVVNQLTLNLKRIEGLGVKKIVVPALQPLGCLPRSTVNSSYQDCNDVENRLVEYHNNLLQKTVAKLNNETKESTFLVLDLYNAFLTVFKNKGERPGSSKFENPLKPCCVGTSKEDQCGSLDNKGAKKYTMCDDPKSAFFWDFLHPTQEGWHTIYTVLRGNLTQIFNN